MFTSVLIGVPCFQVASRWPLVTELGKQAAENGYSLWVDPFDYGPNDY